AIGGSYCEATGCHGFLRVRDGSFTTFDPPGTIEPNLPAFVPPGGINPAGAITGYYSDLLFAPLHGFLRAPDGTFTTFDAPAPVNGTLPQSINPAGAIAGSYFDANTVAHGFLRPPDGTFIAFDVPGAGTGLFQGTYPSGLNPSGAITGYYCDATECH